MRNSLMVLLLLACGLGNPISYKASSDSSHISSSNKSVVFVLHNILQEIVKKINVGASVSVVYPSQLYVPVHKSSLRSCWICFRLFRWLSLKMQQIMRKYKRCTDGFVTWMMFVCGGSRRGLREECLCFHPMMPGMGHGVADTALVWG